MPRPRCGRPARRRSGRRYAGRSGTPTAAGVLWPPAARGSGPAGAGAGTASLVCSTWALLLLAFLAADGFLGVLDPLALVGLRRPVAADLGGDLADPLAVGAGDRDRRWPLAGDPHLFRDRVGDIVAVAELQIERAALHGGAVADPVDLQVAREAGRNAVHHVVDQRPGRAPHRPRPFGLALRGDRDGAFRDRRGNLLADREAQRAEPPFGGQGLARQLDFDAGGDRDGMLTDTRHVSFPKSLGLEHATKNFAADFGGAGLVVGQDPARGRQDRDAEPVIDPRQVDQLGINPPARLRHA